MSTTETQPASSDQSTPTEITIFTRLASIPIISSSLESLNGVLTKNALTRHPYAHAKAFSGTAYKITEPIQVRLAPLITRADGYANKAVDVVQARYPYAFQAQPQDVASYMRERKDNTISGVNKAIDDQVTTRAKNVARGIDNRFTPIVDVFEHAVSRLKGDAGPSTPPDAKYQYQRVLALSKILADDLRVYTQDHFKTPVIAQRASEKARAITTALTSTVHELTSIIWQKDLPVQERVSRVSKNVQSRVTPILDTVKKGVTEVLARSHGASSDGSNGHAASDTQ